MKITFVLDFFQVPTKASRKMIVLDTLPRPSTVKTTKTRKPKATSCEDWQRNYINEYSKVFLSNEALKKENFELKETIETLQMRLENAKNERDQYDETPKNTSDSELIEIKKENVELRETIETLQMMLKNAENERNQFDETPKNWADAELDDTDSGFDQIAENERNQFDETPKFSTDAELVDTDSGNAQSLDQTDTSKYICECGYNAGDLKNRLMTHQKQFCKLYIRSVPSNLRCPICGIQNTYLAIKSHLTQFIRAGRKNKTRDARHQIATQSHIDALAAFKKKYGPKKSRKAGKKTTKSTKKKSNN